MDKQQSAKLSDLKEIIEGYGSLLVAFSGGCDSTLLLKVAGDVLGDRAMAVTARSETYPSEEYEEAARIARQLGVTHLTIDTSELSVKDFSSNPPDRCYFCKAELFRELLELARQNGIRYVADGSSLDDASDHRPGMRAAAELGVVSPLRKARFTKEDIRKTSRALGLDTWDKPSFACLASRFPYGEEITAKKLKMAGTAENFLRRLGFRQVRVRHHGTIARIEVPEEDIRKFADNSLRQDVASKLREIGYAYVSLDLTGYRTGSLNEVLPPSQKPEEKEPVT
ncbi:ATP-dependent sacrificial sulfur transferase LarE [bacterium]|nr:ATP-dependent sacrificial sulfur transferase LarE [bacterium]